MLEYLSQRKVFYPYYPSIELQDLREKCVQLETYQALARIMIDDFDIDQEQILNLPPNILLSLIDDPTVCYSPILGGLLDLLLDPRDIERVLHRMCTWKDFDWDVVEDIIADSDSKTRPWYQSVVEIYNQRYPVVG